MVRCARTLSSSWKTSSRNWAYGSRWLSASCRRTSRLLSSRERLGVWADCLSVLVVVMGWMVVIDAVRVGLEGPDQGIALGKGEVALLLGRSNEALHVYDPSGARLERAGASPLQR